MSTTAYDHLIATLELSETAEGFRNKAGTLLKLNVQQDGDALIIHEIVTVPTRTGLGSQVVDQLELYAETNGLWLEVSNPLNREFWDRYDIPCYDND